MRKFITFIFLLFIFIALSGCTKTYNVTFTSKDLVIETQNIKEGQYAKEIFPEEITGEVFIAWYNGDEEFDFSTPIANDLELIAKWENEIYTITFKNDDGSVIKKVQVAYNEEIIAPNNPTKKSDDNYDYTFAGWDTEFTTASSDMTITATYISSIRKFTVTFYNEDKTVNAEIKVENGGKVGNLTLSKEDDDLYSYSFNGWYTADGEKFSFNSTITADLKLYPKFTATPHFFTMEGKKISIIGDSISTFYSATSSLNSYYSGTNEFYYPAYSASVNTANKTWWGMLLNSFNATLGVNNSLSGSSLCGTSNKAAISDARIQTLDDNGTPDVIIVFIGTNDNVNGHTVEQFKSTYEKLLQKLHTAYPNAYVFCFNLGYSNYHLNNPTNHYYYSEETRLAYNEAIKQVCKDNLATLIDLASIQTTSTYNSMLGDNLHPNYEGMRKISSLVLSTITDFFNEGKDMYFINYGIDESTTLGEDSFEYFYEGDKLALPTPIKEGYEFLGWYTNEDLSGNPITSTEGINSNLDIYPWFEVELQSGEYRVIFNTNGGSIGETDRTILANDFLTDLSAYLETPITSIEEWGCTATLKETDPNNPDMIAYTIVFDQAQTSWKQEDIYNMLKESEYSAKWQWLVDYINACAINNKAYVSNSPENPWPEPLMIELYAFFKGAKIEWTGIHESADYSQPEILAENVNILDYASFKTKAYSESILASDLPTPTKDGYTFAGWYTDKELSTPVTEITTGCTIYAKWE